MITILSITTLILLAAIIIQDFRYRAIWWWLPPLLFAGLLWQGAIETSWPEISAYLLTNTVIIALQLLLVSLYFWFRNRAVFNIIGKYLGAGDVLFFAAVTAAFSPFNFMVFYLSALVTVLAGFIVYRLMKRAVNPQIPLAGGMSIVLLFYTIFKLSFQYKGSYNDSLLLSLF